MVPGACGTDLHDVAGEGPLAGTEAREFARRRDAASVGGKPRAEHVPHPYQLGASAYRAVLTRGLPAVDRGAAQLRMRVADILATEPVRLEVGKDRLTCQAIVDFTARGGQIAGGCRWLNRHGPKDSRGNGGAGPRALLSGSAAGFPAPQLQSTTCGVCSPVTTNRYIDQIHRKEPPGPVPAEEVSRAPRGSQSRKCVRNA
jgi:hypothetical protein